VSDQNEYAELLFSLDYLAKHSELHTKSAAAIRALQARVMELEKDAGRYRFIRDNVKDGAVKTLLPLYRAHYFVSLEPISECPTFDEAIDAAIRPTESGKGE
jgi:hypothetical protein